MREFFSVRVLGAGDVAPFRAVLGVFAEAFRDHETYLARQPDDAYLEQLLASPTFVAVAAILEEDIVGGLAAYVLPKFEQPRSEMYIYDLAVKMQHRRLGIATAMIAEVQRLAAESDTHVIFVQADYGDDPAVSLYSALGAKEEVLHFDIPPKVSPNL